MRARLFFLRYCYWAQTDETEKNDNNILPNGSRNKNVNDFVDLAKMK